MEFVYTPVFEGAATGLLDEEQRRQLEAVLLDQPEAGQLIVGTGGLRKIRFAQPGRGKRGGLRVLYYYDKPDETIYFVLVYPKNVKGALTQAEKNALRKYLETL